MARKRLEDVLDDLGRVRADPHSPESSRLLKQALAGRSPHATAKAAKLVGELGLDSLAPELEQAFARWLEAGAADVGCTAKTAVVRALDRVDHADARVFLQGIRHVQLEGGYGQPTDVATELRGLCALALVRIGYSDALAELCDLLADRQSHARAAAARALRLRDGDGAVALLRFKARLGDDEPDVLCECLTALLAAAPRASLAFVVGFLEARDEAVAEAAALALGASRLPEAFEPLRDWHERTHGSQAEASALTALATLRVDAALDYVVGVVRSGTPRSAERALQALALYRGDEALAERVRQAAEASADARVLAVARRAFA